LCHASEAEHELSERSAPNAARRTLRDDKLSLSLCLTDILE